jgi:SAM-dependent methyltransferase
MANEIERRRWNNAEMVANWPKRERFTDLVVPRVVAALNPQPGEKVLDIGSGGGKLSIAIAERVRPRGKVTGADISEGMVAMATARAAEARAANASFVVCDAQSERAPGGPFDAVTSQFGVMFFEDPHAAFSNLHASLKKGGRLAFACWQTAPRNRWHTGSVLAKFVPAPPPPAPGKAPTGPFALGDPRRTRSILAAAGFEDIQRTPKRLIVVASSDVIGDEAQIASAGIPKEKFAEAAKAMEKHFDQFRLPDGNCRFELNIQIFTARK